MKRLILLLAVALAATGLGRAQPAVGGAGDLLPPWTPGTLDIHQISTGRGNAAFFRFPDGTTMLVDAGAAGDGIAIPETEPRPTGAPTAGGWIARYITLMMAPGAPHLDYALLTHFHADHMGQVTAASKPSASGAYKLTGITEVGDRIPIAVMIDRGAPDYDYLVPANDPTLKNYRAFVAEQTRTRGMALERFRVGAADQIVLRKTPARYPSFEVRNVAGNGVVWTGRGDATSTIFPPLDSLAPEDRPSENMCSLALRIRDGRFSYFTGGDMPGIPDVGSPSWMSVETPVARAIGPTDVHVVNHHGSIDPESEVFLKTLASAVMILPAWSTTHPSQDALKRMMTARLYPGPHDVYATVLHPSTKLSIGGRAAEVKADHGDIVVRVAPGGGTYQVFVLDDLSETPRILSVHGPYRSRAGVPGF